MLKKLNFILSANDKKLLVILVIISILISMLEMIGIGAVMPFISVTSNFDLVHTNQYLKAVYDFFSFGSEIHFVVVCGLILVGFYIFRSAANLLYFYFLARFSRGRYHSIAYRMFKKYLKFGYKNFLDKTSSELIRILVTEIENLSMLLVAVLFMISEIFVVIFIYFIMLYIDYKITIFMTIFLGLNAVLLIKLISPAIKRAGDIRVQKQNDFYNIANTTINNFKFIKLKSNHRHILDDFKTSSFYFARANIANDTLVQIPRLYLEGIGFCILIALVLYLVVSKKSDISSEIAVISMFVLGLYRLMPSVNRILHSYNQILYFKNSFDEVYNTLKEPEERLYNEFIGFEREIVLKNVKFSYNGKNDVLKDINLTIKKGSKVAFIGESGSGKSTLVDLLMGLYEPMGGEVRVDGVLRNNENLISFRQKIGYIPQQIYLFNGSVANNIAFDSPVKKERLDEVIKMTNLQELIDKLPDGINSNVGDGGSRLSGGQKQRIAIARAIYADPEILILDEATSALDDKTEGIIMDEIYKVAANKTLIIIAHRLTTIKNCDFVYKIVDGNIQMLNL